MKGNCVKKMAMVMDSSGSMRGWKIEEVKDIFPKLMADKLKGQDHGSIITFDTDFDNLFPLSNFTKTNIEKMKKIARKIQAGGNTALYDALGFSIDYLIDNSDDEELTVFGLTDGKDNSSERFETPKEVEEYANSRGVDLTIHLIGIGENVDKQALETIARGTGGKYIPAESNPASVGRAADKAGDIIGRRTGKNKRPVNKNPTNPVNPTRAQNKPVNKSNKQRKGIRFEGNISRDDIDYMEDIAREAEKIIDQTYPLKTGTTSVPTYILPPEKFESIFGKDMKPTRYRDILYRQIPTEDYHRSDYYEKNGDHPPRTAIGTGRHGSGELLAIFVNDTIFHRFEERLEENDVPEVTPGIYIKDIRNQGINGVKNIRCAMSHLAVTSVIYYSTSRISTIKRLRLTDIYSVFYSTLSLLCNDINVLDEFIRNSILLGSNRSSNIPLHLIRSARSANPKEILKKFYGSLPVHDLLTGNINRENEEDYINELAKSIGEIRRKYC